MREFEEETPPWQFAFEFDLGLDFAAYVAKVNDWPKGLGIPEGWVPNSYLVGVVDGKVVGRLSLRHKLNEFLQSYGGHVGYGVVPSERRRGYASEMLRQALPICAELGIEQAIVSCDVDNSASKKVIEKNGGVFDSTTELLELDVQKHIYWIHTATKKNMNAEQARSDA